MSDKIKTDFNSLHHYQFSLESKDAEFEVDDIRRRLTQLQVAIGPWSIARAEAHLTSTSYMELYEGQETDVRISGDLDKLIYHHGRNVIIIRHGACANVLDVAFDAREVLPSSLAPFAEFEV